jgi:hypothetical protein
VELQERKVLEEERYRQQRIHQEEERTKKIQKERQWAIQVEQERQKRLEEQSRMELRSYHEWKTFLPPPTGTPEEEEEQEHDSIHNKTITVKEWIKELEQRDNKTMSIQELSHRFHVSNEQVCTRIQELIDGGRITGIIQSSSSDGSDSRFMYLSPKDRLSLSMAVKRRGKIDIQWFRNQIQQHIKTS